MKTNNDDDNHDYDDDNDGDAAEPHLTHGPLGPPKSSTQMASRSVQPFLQGLLV